MDLNDKVIIGSTAVILLSAATMLAISKKYDNSLKTLQGDITNINYIVSKSRDDILIGNKTIEQGNAMLRELIKANLEVEDNDIV